MLVLGRRNKLHLEEQNNFRLSLAKTNLQSGQIKGEFKNADFSGCRFDGAYLEGNFKKCNFSQSRMQSIEAKELTANDCDFSAADVSGAFLGAAKLDSSRFWFAEMDRTNLNGSSLKASDFYEARVNHVYFHQAADCSYSRFTECNPAEFKGIETGPTKRLWYNGSFKSVENLLTSDLLGKQDLISEWGDRKAWKRQCHAEDLLAPFS